MKKITLTLIAFATIFSSCTKIIDVELEDANKRTTIDAIIKNGLDNVTTRITKSGNFFGSTSNPAISDATVVLNDGTTDYPLSNLGNGNYELTGFTANTNKSYSMKVTQGGEIYEATTFMPTIVRIDTVNAVYQPASTFNEEGYVLSIVFQDSPSVENYYRIELDIAGERYGAIDDLILLDDGLLDGNLVEFPMFGADVAQLGDTVIMYLNSIDKQAFDYYNAIDNILYGNAEAPANPKSNFDNNALGNFSAFTTDTLVIVVQ